MPAFTHLIMHSDADGFYVPTDFPTPLLPGVMDDISAPIWPLGSTQRLQAEVDLLVAVLEIPSDLGSQDEAL